MSPSRRTQRMLDPGSFPCSSPLPAKLSPLFPRPRKRPSAAVIRATGLGVRDRNVTPNLSPKPDLSPELESRPFYSTRFLADFFSHLSLVVDPEGRYPFCLPLAAMAPANPS